MLNGIITCWRKEKLKRMILKKSKIRIIVGAGGKKQKGWLPTEQGILDITKEANWKYLLGKKKASKILAEHVLEHLSKKEIRTTLKNASKFLEPGGIFRVAVPDGYHPSKYVIDLTKPNGLESGAEDHKIMLNIDLLRKLAEGIDLELHPKEYFNRKGKFHSTKWSSKDGYVSRTAKNYRGRFTKGPREYDKFIISTPEKLRQQFISNNFSYTSLFVDFVKPK